MRMIMGLDRPDTGTARVHGRPYQELRRPLREVGALLEDPSRTEELARDRWFD